MLSVLWWWIYSFLTPKIFSSSVDSGTPATQNDPSGTISSHNRHRNIYTYISVQQFLRPCHSDRSAITGRRRASVLLLLPSLKRPAVKWSSSEPLFLGLTLMYKLPEPEAENNNNSLVNQNELLRDEQQSVCSPTMPPSVHDHNSRITINNDCERTHEAKPSKSRTLA